MTGVLYPGDFFLQMMEHIGNTLAEDTFVAVSKLKDQPAWLGELQRHAEEVGKGAGHLKGLAWDEQRGKPCVFVMADALYEMQTTYKLPQRKLAELTGVAETKVSKLLRLLHLEPELQRQVRENRKGLLSFRHLCSIARLPQEQQKRMADDVRKQRWTATQTQKRVRYYLKWGMRKTRRYSNRIISSAECARVAG